MPLGSIQSSERKVTDLHSPLVDAKAIDEGGVALPLTDICTRKYVVVLDDADYKDNHSYRIPALVRVVRVDGIEQRDHDDGEY